MTYLEEYDQSKRSSNKMGSGKYNDFSNSISESIEKQPIAKPKRKNSYDESEIEDEIGSMIDDDSIKEDIEESYPSSSSAFEDFKKRQYKLASENKIQLENLAT